MSFLTVAIPVWNAINEIRRTTDSLSELAMDGVSIMIADNNSDDGTWEFLQDSKDPKSSNFLLIRNQRNFGFRGNLKVLASHCETKYIWFIGAGEVVEQAALNMVLKELKRSNPALMILRGQVDPTPGLTLDHLEFDNFPQGFPFSESISLNIFRSDIAQSVLSTNPKPPIDKNSWPHLEIALASQDAGSVLVQSAGAPVVSISRNPAGWWYHTRKALDIYADKLNLGSENLLVSSSQEFRELATIQGLRFAFEVRMNGELQSSESTRRFISALSSGYRILATCILKSPRFVLRSLAAVKRRASQFQRASA